MWKPNTFESRGKAENADEEMKAGIEGKKF